MTSVLHDSAKLGDFLGFSEEQIRKVAAISMTKAAYNVQSAIQNEMRSKFHNPKPFVLNSVYVRQAKIDGNTITPAEIGIRGVGESGVTPAHVIASEIFGGLRRGKASEDAMHRIMPQGSQWVPGQGAPLDSGLDIPGAYMRKILSAMQAIQNEGHDARSKIQGTAGVTAKKRLSMSKKGVELNRNGEIKKGLRGYDANEVHKLLTSKSKNKLTNFFVGNPKGSKAGIGPSQIGKAGTILYQFDWYQKPGKRRPNNPNHEPVLVRANVRPVLIFTRPQHYRIRLPFFNLAERLAIQDMPRIVEQESLRLWAKWGGK